MAMYSYGVPISSSRRFLLMLILKSALHLFITVVMTLPRHQGFNSIVFFNANYEVQHLLVMAIDPVI